MVHGDAPPSFSFHAGKMKEVESVPLSIGSQRDYPSSDSPDAAATILTHHPNACATYLSSLDDNMAKVAPLKMRTEATTSSHVEALCSLLSLASDGNGGRSLGPSRRQTPTSPPSISNAVDSLPLPDRFLGAIHSLSSMSGDTSGVGPVAPSYARLDDRHCGLNSGM